MTATQAPLETVSVGDITVTYLPDGTLRNRPQDLYGDTDSVYWDEHLDFVDRDGYFLQSCGAFFVQSEGRGLLVDLAFGPKSLDLSVVFGGSGAGEMVGGDLFASLRHARIDPKDIDTVAFSHLHLDHIGWTLHGADELAFPEADHLATKAEWEYWRQSESSPVGPTEAQLDVLERRLVTVDDSAEIIPGVRALTTPGHTPGHMSFDIKSRNERAIIVGDVFHCPLEIPKDRLKFTVDADPLVAEASRDTLREAAQRGARLFSGHFPSSAFSH